MANKNTVGAVVPSAEQTQQLQTQSKGVADGIRSWGAILKPEDRHTFLKPRTGAEKLFDLLVSLAEANAVNIATMPLSDMKADLAVARAAEGIERELAVAHQLASDTRLAAYGESWQAFLGYYGVLSSMASRDPDLAKNLAPITDFMARRRAQPQPKPE
jgi:hypothetical protein